MAPPNPALTYLCGHSFGTRGSGFIPKLEAANYVGLRNAFCSNCQPKRSDTSAIQQAALQSQAASVDRGYPPLPPPDDPDDVMWFQHWSSAECIRYQHLGFLDRAKQAFSGLDSYAHKRQGQLDVIADCLSRFETRFDEWQTLSAWLSNGHHLWLPHPSTQAVHITCLARGFLVEYHCTTCGIRDGKVLPEIRTLWPCEWTCSNRKISEHKVSFIFAPDWIEYWVWYDMPKEDREEAARNARNR